ncbi:MAG TPA: mechanosensitive ion channel domain-containing protein [Acidobacteriota bacterium]|nr:mechanosensitive ion channel domain-containing protein [Acidobacteriota bacterium]
MVESLVQWIMEQGVDARSAEYIAIGTATAAILLVAFIADRIAKGIILVAVHRLILRTSTDWDDVLVDRKVFVVLSHLAPAAVLYWGFHSLFPESEGLLRVVERVVLAYMMLVGFFVAARFLDAVNDVYSRQDMARKRPIKGYLQAIKIGLFLVAAILVMATLFNQPVLGLFSLLGGLTAVLLLVFRDTILGFVASIWLTNNDMVRKGDWISMPKYDADGDVVDITIHTVKVQNWDKTYTTIPTYALISDAFTNWRGMQESGGRRIKRSINIDMNSVTFCDDEMVERLKKIDALREYLASKSEELKKHNEKYGIDTSIKVNGRRMTNLGTFRAYLGEFLKRNPYVHEGMTMLVRHLAPTAQGLPVEIYCFSNDQAWANYENIQADIFDHILAVIPEFGLRVFQEPTGADFRVLNQHPGNGEEA